MSSHIAELLVKHGIVQAAAIDDPDGYDGGRLRNAVELADREVQARITELQAEGTAEVERRRAAEAARDAFAATVSLLHENVTYLKATECQVLRGSTMDGLCHDGSPCPCAGCYAARLRKKLVEERAASLCASADYQSHEPQSSPCDGHRAEAEIQIAEELGEK